MEVKEVKRKLLSLDFDGVIHSYTSGWHDVDVAKDDPVPGAAEFLHHAATVFDVQVFSSRSSSLLGRQCMRNYIIYMMNEWFKTVRLDSKYEEAASWVYSNIQFPKEKGPCWLHIDDRVICFDGVWPDLTTIDQFKPWNKKPRISEVTTGTYSRE